MDWNAKWIKSQEDLGAVAPEFSVSFALRGPVREAKLYITALGVYEAQLNGSRVGSFILAPGWTSYPKRLQYQEYDVSDLLQEENRLQVLVGRGWYRSRMPGWEGSEYQKKLQEKPSALLAQLEIVYDDGSRETICSGSDWTVRESAVRFSEIYDGEIYDATRSEESSRPVEIYEGPSETLIPQQGEEIREQERIFPARIFTTPKGEVVVDFGQEITGYVETNMKGCAGEVLDLSFAEVMDKEGNFYTENYRSAKAQYRYVCRDGMQTYKPKLTFWGFRYIRINSFPGGMTAVAPERFAAIVLHSDMKRTGRLSCSNPLLNRFFENVVWGQKGNFLDVPTDCPQRDERLGWTGDAQAFVRTASLNFDVEKFFTKWLADMAADQWENGYVGHVIPDLIQNPKPSAAWADAATICPWTIYLAYGNPEILENQFECMHKWVDYITQNTKNAGLWTGGEHYGDWLGLDAPSGSYKGSTREEFIASAFYAYSTSLVIKAGRVLGKDVSAYEKLYHTIVYTFRRTFPDYRTQTECVLAAHFRLAENPQAAADQLASMISSCGTQLQTGFVGTPYLLHVLSDYGYTELAYSLLLREKYPSWLYPVTKGATTVWEHWDGIMENGDFWSANMNSYNHYAYGCVTDWVYSVAAGINALEEAPGYAKVRISPLPDKRLDWLEASLDTRHGRIVSRWEKETALWPERELWKYQITAPVEAEIVIAGKSVTVPAGTYQFYSLVEEDGEA